jgi:hypothetical protein
LQEKIDECANTIIGLHTIYRYRKKTIIQQLQEIRQLAEDLNIDDIRLRKMVSQSFTIMGVSSSWMRRLLPEYLKSTKHTRKDYLELQQRRDQQSLQQQRQTTKKQQWRNEYEDNDDGRSSFSYRHCDICRLERADWLKYYCYSNKGINRQLITVCIKCLDKYNHKKT